MADITFGCPRLSCRVCRHAGPCARKTSATSGTEVLRVSDAVQVLQRADDFAQQVGGDLRVKRSGLELLVAEQHLDHADVHLLFEQVRREAVAQRVHRHALVDLRGLGSGMDGAVQLPRAERIDGIKSGKQP
jgi:hypothetical protein